MDEPEMDAVDPVVADDIARAYEDLPEQWYGGAVPERESEPGSEPEPEPGPVPGKSLWQRLSELWPSPEEYHNRQQQRLEELNQALMHYPETPATYVLRGELYLEMGEVEAAVDDFGRALGIASAQVETDDWGFISQVMQDRAEVGLKEAENRLRSNSESNMTAF
jgi:tetratricopeptide (TPR) repeat protein